MRDLNRKLDKFVKEKAASSAKLNRMLSPHVTYGVIASPTTANTTITKNITNIKKPNSRNYSMTVSFYNPKYQPGYPKDYSVRHEVAQEKKLNIRLASPERIKSPKRDPILQNNDEGVMDMKPSIKHFPNAGQPTMFTAEPKVSQRGVGDFNLLHHPRSISPRRIEGIKTDIPHPKENTPEKERRLRKKVKVPHTNNFDIILEGDLSNLINKGRRHVSPQPHIEAQKFNDRKHLLAADRGTSNRGKVFRDSKVKFGAHPIEIDTEVKPQGKRFVSPRQQNRADGMKSLVEYEYSLPYREEKLSPKCNHISFADLTISANSSMILQ